MASVQPCSRMRSSAAPASHASIRWVLAPRTSGAVTPMANPVAWVTGEGMNITSCVPICRTFPASDTTVNATVLNVW
jgi:hypothetical protein